MNRIDYLSATQICMEAFSDSLQPLCKETGLNQTSIGILTYIAKMPNFNSAKDVCKQSALKPNLVSFHVDKLVSQGYLIRSDIPEDRRKVKLILTDKALSVVDKAISIEHDFIERITVGIDDETKEILREALSAIIENAKEIRNQTQQ